MAPREGWSEVSGMPTRSHPRPPVNPSALNASGDSQWTNLGYWGSEVAAGSATAAEPQRAPGAATAARQAGTRSTYAVAATSLARRVGVAAALRAGDVVVDYACGFGDSLRLWVEEFEAARVVGIEPDPAVCAAINARIRSWQLESRVRVHCARAEDLHPREADAGVSAVVCVDSAYHFRTRRSWLGMLASGAPEGTRVALADLAVLPGSERSLRLRALARLMQIPRANLLSARSMAIDAEDAGFSVQSCEHVGAQVLDGFVEHAPRGTLAVDVTRAALAHARRYRLLDYCIIGALR